MMTSAKRTHVVELVCGRVYHRHIRSVTVAPPLCKTSRSFIYHVFVIFCVRSYGPDTMEKSADVFFKLVLFEKCDFEAYYCMLSGFRRFRRSFLFGISICMHTWNTLRFVVLFCFISASQCLLVSVYLYFQYFSYFQYSFNRY
jgi:hypothetical protein